MSFSKCVYLHIILDLYRFVFLVGISKLFRDKFCFSSIFSDDFFSFLWISRLRFNFHVIFDMKKCTLTWILLSFRRSVGSVCEYFKTRLCMLLFFFFIRSSLLFHFKVLPIDHLRLPSVLIQ